MRQKLIFLIILILGIFFRFFELGKQVVFYGDHARDFLTTFKIVKFGEIVWHGPAASVTWNLLSPVYYYLLLPFYVISNWHPLTQIGLTALVSLLTIGLLYKLFNPTVAFIYAISTIIVAENLIGLNPGFVPPATVILAWSLIKTNKGSSKHFLIVAATLAWMISFHVTGFFIIPPLVILFLWKRPKITLEHLILSGLIFTTIAVIPYAIQEKKFGGYNLITVKNYFLPNHEKPLNALKVTKLESLANFSQIVFFTPGDILFPTTNQNLRVISNLIIWATLIAIVVKRKGLNLPQILLGLYLLTFFLAINFSSPNRPNWWFGNVVFPLAVIVFGDLISKVRSRIALVVVLLLVLFSNLTALNRSINSGSFGRFDQEKQIAQNILTSSAKQYFNLKYIYKGHDEDGAQGPFAYLFWYFDHPQFQDKYFRWLNWQKPPADFPLYLIFQETSPSGKEAWLDKYSDHDQKLIKQTNFYEIYKVE